MIAAEIAPTPTKNQQARQAAYRAERGYRGGVVIFSAGEVAGWMNELRDPHKWQPGCIAVAEEGKQWVALGGDDYNGAGCWIPAIG